MALWEGGPDRCRRRRLFQVCAVLVLLIGGSVEPLTPRRRVAKIDFDRGVDPEQAALWAEGFVLKWQAEGKPAGIAG